MTTPPPAAIATLRTALDKATLVDDNPAYILGQLLTALDRGGWQIVPATPPTIPATFLDQLAEVGNKALNDHYHEDLCHCSGWPENCRHYAAGQWDTSGFDIALPAILAAYEQYKAQQ